MDCCAESLAEVYRRINHHSSTPCRRLINTMSVSRCLYRKLRIYQSSLSLAFLEKLCHLLMTVSASYDPCTASILSARSLIVLWSSQSGLLRDVKKPRPLILRSDDSVNWTKSLICHPLASLPCSASPYRGLFGNPWGEMVSYCRARNYPSKYASPTHCIYSSIAGR